MSYIHFVDAGESKSGLTKIWYVKSDAGATLGTVGWYANWRRYCFYPEDNSIFDANCLTEITQFLRDQTRDHAS